MIVNIYHDNCGNWYCEPEEGPRQEIHDAQSAAEATAWVLDKWPKATIQKLVEPVDTPWPQYWVPQVPLVLEGGRVAYFRRESQFGSVFVVLADGTSLSWVDWTADDTRECTLVSASDAASRIDM
jgi:hypothetical protein